MTTNQHKNTPKKSENGRLWAGILILVIGFGLLARQLGMDIYFPYWVLSWPMALVVIGLVIGGNSNFRNPASIVLIGLGTVFLIQKYLHYNVWKFVFPAAIIGVGLYLLFAKKVPKGLLPDDDHRPSGDDDHYGTYYKTGQETSDAPDFTTDQNRNTTDHAEAEGPGNYGDRDWSRVGDEEAYLSSTAIFSEEKKIVTSRNLQGGEVVNIFGGTDINLMHADIQGPIVIDIFQLFAGTKIIVPAHWKVHSKVVSVFGEVDDRRFYQESAKTEKKIIYLKGTSIFGGITIKSM